MLWSVLIIASSCFLIGKNWAIGYFTCTMIGLTFISVSAHYNFNLGEYLTNSEFDDISPIGLFSPLKIGIPLFAVLLVLIDFVRINRETDTELINNLDEKENLLETITNKEKVLSSILDSTGDTIYELNNQAQLIYCNPALEKLVGYTYQDLRGKNIHFLIPKEHLNKRLQAVSKQITEKNRVAYDQFPICNRNGEIVWVGQTTTMLFDKKGNFTKAICTARNITEQKATRENLVLAKEKAEEASLAKARFLSAMSHEIRTPMNAIIGIINLMQSNNGTPEQIDSLRFSANNLLALINDILDFNDLDRNSLTLTKEEFSIQDMAKYVGMGLDGMARKKELNFQLNIDNKIPKTIIGDPLRLSQVLNNLTHNALKFTEQGTVTIDIIEHSQTEEKVEIFFGITDTGRGIPIDQRNTILNEFAQVEKSTILEGAGLGLAITSKLLELYKSKIHIESEVGIGSKFSFIISFDKLSNTARNDSPDSNKNNSNLPADKSIALMGRKILIVEDNLLNQKITKKILERWGAEAPIAENGKIAVEMVQQTKYDLILMDLQMPVMNGIEATKLIRMIKGYTQKVPIIALTASAVVEVKEEALASGMNHFISKPFRPDNLFEKICEHLPSTQSA